MSWISSTVIKDNEYISLPCPAYGSSGITISTLVDGGNNANGNFIGTIIGKDKLQIDMSFSHLTPEEFKTFLNLFDRDRGGKFFNEFIVFDPRESKYVTKKMYVSDRTGRPLGLNKVFIESKDKSDDKDFIYEPSGWTDVSAKLIEL